MSIDHRVIRVHDEWDGWHNAEVALNDLHDVHWLQPPRAPRPLLHAYVSCARLAAGTIPHDCQRTRGPHRLLVCVLKKHTMPSVYTEIAGRAGFPRPTGDRRTIYQVHHPSLLI
jgi:hypothetical protein